MELDSDFKILNNAINSFLRDESIKNKLSHIIKRPNKDWEKWLQIELEYHLEKRCNCTTKREVSAKPDHRYRSGKLGMYIDLLIRKRLFEEDHYIYVELKCDVNAGILFGKMLVDQKKLESIKQSFLDKSNTKMRSYWCIGFFQTTDHGSTEAIKIFLKEYYAHYKNKCAIKSLCTCYSEKKCKCGSIGYIIF